MFGSCVHHVCILGWLYGNNIRWQGGAMWQRQSGGLWWQTKSTGEAGSLASDAVSVVGDEEGEVSVKDHVDGDPEGDARAGAAGVVQNPE